MGSKSYKKLSVHERAQHEKLAKLGVIIDPETGPVFAPQGAVPPEPEAEDPELSQEGPGDSGTDEDQEEAGTDGDQEEDSSGRYDELEPADEDPSVDPLSADDPVPPARGELKRAHDARDAQRRMSKTQAKLDAMHANLEQKILLLDSKLKEMKDLRKSLDQVAADFSPADAETVRLYRDADEDAFRVMQSVAAPALKAVAELSDRLNRLEAQNADSRADRIFQEIYQSIPKARVEELMTDAQFLGWVNALPKRLRLTYIDILNNTSELESPADALAVFSHFTRDTGIQTLINGKAKERGRPPVDEVPSLRTGSSLPSVQRRHQVTQPQKPSSGLKPLTIAERANFSKLIQGIDAQAPDGTFLRGAKTQQERDELRDRLDTTSISVDGSIPQILGSRP
jgi:hypothetical protein